MTKEEMLQIELDENKCFYDLDGCEITKEDAEYAAHYIEQGATKDEAIDLVLAGIRAVLNDNFDD